MVEDSQIIALDAEDILKRLGAGDVLTAGTVEHALGGVDKSKPDLALLDINLGDQTSFAIADRLHHLGIPFLFATGLWRAGAAAEGPSGAHGGAEALHAGERRPCSPQAYRRASEAA
jgi:CheY-like chemotaxis protein